MRLVLFSRVPRWYSFGQDRLVKRLTAEGHEVVGVVAEQTKSIKSLQEWAWKFGPKVFWQKASNKMFRQVSNAVPAVKVPVFRVASHNSIECAEIVRSLRPDVIVLRGCGIIKRPVLEIPRIATINPHYAPLPDYRGMDVTEWSALHGDPIAVSVHTVNDGVDTGAVIVSRLVNVEPGDTVGLLRDKSGALAVELIVEALRIVEKSGPPAAAHKIGGHQYFSMHPRLRQLANERLNREAAERRQSVAPGVSPG